MSDQTYKTLQEVNNSKFEQTPSNTASRQNIPTITSRDNSSNIAKKIYGDFNYEGQSTQRLNPFASDYFNAKWMGIDFGTVLSDRYTNPAKKGIDPYSKHADFEHIRRNEQSLAGTGVNMVTQFTGKTLINTVGGIVGGFYGIGSAVANWDVNKLTDNSVARKLDEGTEWLEENNSIFTSQRARDNYGFLSLETAKDINDAYSFIAGAVSSELLMAYATGGTSLATAPGRYALKGLSLSQRVLNKTQKATGLNRGLNQTALWVNKGEDAISLINKIDVADVTKIEELAKQYGTSVEAIRKMKTTMDKVNRSVGMGRKIITGTFWEGGLEARHAKDDFISTMTSKIDEELALNGLTGEEAEQYKRERLDEINKAGDSVGNYTFGLNVAILQASNIVQFPSIFGRKAVTSANAMSGNLTRKGLGEYIKGSKKASVIKYLGAALKSPATEFMEETGQGLASELTKNYYETILGTDSLSGELNRSISAFSDAFNESVKKTYGTKEGIHEGLIGAVVGAIGLPMLKRNKQGKLRSVKMTGGVFEAVSSYNKENAKMKEAIEMLNLSDHDTLLKYNLDNALIASNEAKKEDIANISNDELELAALNDNKIFRHVMDRLDKGLEDYMDADFQEIKDMSIEDYRTKFKRSDDFTKEDKDKEVNALTAKANIYKDAYKKVFKGLEMSTINNNKYSKKLFDVLTYSIANEKILRDRQDLLIDRMLKDPSVQLSKEELLSLAKLDGKYKQFQSDIDEIIRLEEENRLDKFNTKRKSITEKLKKVAGTDKTGLINNVLDENSSTKQWIESIAAFEDQLRLNPYQELTDKDKEFYDIAKNILNLDKDEIKQVKLSMEFLEKHDKTKDKTKVSKPEQLKKVKEKRATEQDLLNSIQEKIKKQESESLRTLTGKKQDVTLSEIKEYLKLQKSYRSKIQTPGKSLLDSLGEDTMDVDIMLEELSKITKKQILSLEVATSLYGFNNNGYGKIVNASFQENLSNLMRDLQTVQYLSNSGLLTDEDLSELYENISVVVDKIEKDLNEFSDVLPEEFVNQVKFKLEIAKKLLDAIKEQIEIEDKKDSAHNDALNKAKANEDKEALKKLKTDTEDQEDHDEEADNESKGLSTSEEFDQSKRSTFSSKTLWTFGPGENNPDYKDFKEKIESGEIKYNAGAIASYIEENESKVDSKVKEAYLRGKQKVIENPALLKENVDNLDPDVKIFVTYAPVQLKVLDKEVEQGGTDEFKTQEIKDLEDAKEVASVFLPAPKLEKATKEELEKFDIARKEIQNAGNIEFAEIASRDISEEEKIKLIENLNKRIQEELENYNIAELQTENAVNDNILFNIRHALIYNYYINNTEENNNVLKLRIGNFTNGALENFGVNSDAVQEFSLVTEFGENGLVESFSEINEKSIGFGNSKGELITLDNKSRNVNAGSILNKRSFLSSRLYFVHKTKNGQEISVMLNRAKLRSNEKIMNEIMYQLEQYLKEKTPDKIIKLKDKSLSFLEGKSYDEFFYSFFDKNESFNDVTERLQTLSISRGNENNIYIGNLPSELTKIDSQEFLKENYDAIKTAIGSMRFFLNRTQLTPPGKELNRDFLKFILENKLINHAFNVKENRDKIFKAADLSGKPQQVKPQFHILNTEGKRIKKLKEPTNKRLIEILKKAFGLDNVNKNLSSEHLIINMTESVMELSKDLSKIMPNRTDEDRENIVKGAINQTIEKKLNLIKELSGLKPNVLTLDISNIDAINKTHKKETDKALDTYVRLLKAYKDRAMTRTQVLKDYIGNQNFIQEIHTLLLNNNQSVFTASVTPELVEYEEDGATKTRKALKVKQNPILDKLDPEERKKRLTNLMDNFMLLNDTARTVIPIIQKGEEANRKFYVNFTKKFSVDGKKGMEVASHVLSVKYTQDQMFLGSSSGYDIRNNSNYRLVYITDQKTKKDKVKPVIYKIETEDGIFKEVDSPKDFTYNEEGYITNGIVYLGLNKEEYSKTEKDENGKFKKTRTTQSVPVFIGSEVKANFNNVITNIELPGLNSDLTKNEVKFNELETLVAKYRTLYDRINKDLTKPLSSYPELNIEDLNDTGAVDELARKLIENSERITEKKRLADRSKKIDNLSKIAEIFSDESRREESDYKELENLIIQQYGRISFESSVDSALENILANDPELLEDKSDVEQNFVLLKRGFLLRSKTDLEKSLEALKEEDEKKEVEKQTKPTSRTAAQKILDEALDEDTDEDKNSNISEDNKPPKVQISNSNTSKKEQMFDLNMLERGESLLAISVERWGRTWASQGKETSIDILEQKLNHLKILKGNISEINEKELLYLFSKIYDSIQKKNKDNFDLDKYLTTFAQSILKDNSIVVTKDKLSNCTIN